MKLDKTPMTFNNIIVWRHAEAHPALVQGKDDFLAQNEHRDLARTLTPKGKRQAKRMANWLAERLPKDVLIVSSPAMRAFQTAQALKCEVKVLEALKPSANLQEILLVLASLEDSSKNLLLVGHQPWLWQLVAHLTGFTAQEISIKKGAAWWLRPVLDKGLNRASSADARYTIVAVQSPSLLT